jgi:hypothetical protein
MFGRDRAVGLKSALTLTLSRRERGLIGVDSGTASIRATESNSDFERHEDLLPFPLAPLGERAGGEGVGF